MLIEWMKKNSSEMQAIKMDATSFMTVKQNKFDEHF